MVNNQTSPAFSVFSLIYDCNDPKSLSEFYAKLLSGEVSEDPYGGHTVILDNGFSIGFQFDKFYKRPVFLGTIQDQQPMAHLDFKVQDKESAIGYALSLGATMPLEQFCQPEWEVQWTTLLDPAGHPFCLFE